MEPCFILGEGEAETGDLYLEFEHRGLSHLHLNLLRISPYEWATQGWPVSQTALRPEPYVAASQIIRIPAPEASVDSVGFPEGL